ncbi:hypothetical protein OAC63_05210 [Amylibacter sp.]|jgi:hypothetical protein|nr:hypothetical protein [Amylibacter sp.]
MVDLTLREEGTSPKGTPLTNSEVDNNFIALNDELTRVDQSIAVIANEEALILSIALG